MTTVVESVRHRVDPRPLTVLVALVDAALIGVFVVAGEISHDVNPIANPWFVTETYVPFLLGWALTAFLGGLYTRQARHSPLRAVAWTVPAWIGAAIVAQVLRATPLVHGNASPVFFLVSVAVGLALLAPWRVALARQTGE